MRSLIWQQWKGSARRFRELVQRGADPEEAAKLVGSSDGPWHLSRTPLFNQLFSRAWFLAHGLPTFHVWMMVWSAERERIVKNQLSCFKAQAMVAFVGSVLFMVPYPFQDVVLFCNYNKITTTSKDVNVSCPLRFEEWKDSRRKLEIALRPRDCVARGVISAA